MKRIVYTLFMAVFIFGAAGAQKNQARPYHYAFGAGYQPKVKENFFVSMKVYSKKGNAIQFLGYNYRQAWRGTAIFLPNFPISKSGNWKALAGLGLHAGIWKSAYSTANSWRNNPIVGIDGLFGTEVIIPKLHLSFQAHVQPNADLFGNNDTFKDWGGFAMHYTF